MACRHTHYLRRFSWVTYTRLRMVLVLARLGLTWRCRRSPPDRCCWRSCCRWTLLLLTWRRSGWCGARNLSLTRSPRSSLHPEPLWTPAVAAHDININTSSWAGQSHHHIINVQMFQRTSRQPRLQGNCPVLWYKPSLFKQCKYQISANHNW